MNLGKSGRLTKIKLIGIYLLLVVSVVGISYCSNSQDEQMEDSNHDKNKSSAKTLDKIIIRLPWIHQAQYAGVYVAYSKGFFEKNGIKNVEILQGGPGVRPTSLVSSGSEHFSITGATPFFNACFNDHDIVMVSALDQKHAFCYFARKDMGINTPSDFKGKKVGNKLAHEDNLAAILESAGLTLKDVELVSVKIGMSSFFVEDPEKMIPIWSGHAADEALLAEERGIKVNYFFPEEIDGKDRIGNLLFTSKAFKEKYPHIVQGVVSSIIEGWKYAFENPEYAVDQTMKFIDNPESDRKHQKNMLTKIKEFMLTKETGMEIGVIDPDKWKRVLDSYEFRTGNRGLSLDRFIDDSFVKKYYENEHQ